MKYVLPLSEVEASTLTSMYKYHPSTQVRSRAHSILLSHQRFCLQEIAKILMLTRQSISNLFDRWETYGLAGLYDQPRKGRPTH